MKRKAPCKINLALDILGRRPDGYHEMDMIMQTVSLWDCVSVRPAPAGFAIHTGGDLIPAGKKSLEQRASEAFFAHVGREMPGPICSSIPRLWAIRNRPLKSSRRRKSRMRTRPRHWPSCSPATP